MTEKTPEANYLSELEKAAESMKQADEDLQRVIAVVYQLLIQEE